MTIELMPVFMALAIIVLTLVAIARVLEYFRKKYDKIDVTSCESIYLYRLGRAVGTLYIMSMLALIPFAIIFCMGFSEVTLEPDEVYMIVFSYMIIAFFLIYIRHVRRW